MSRRTKKLKYSRAEHRHMAARLPQATESLSAFLWDHLLQRERENKLPWLTPQFATACYEEYRRGDYAQIQLLWDQLEEYDETLATVVAARLGAIAEMPWSIVVDADAVGENSGLQALANAQQATLRAELARVENLEDAIAHLAMADFRGVAALEVVETGQGWRWESIEPWCLARPARRGPWMYNAEARSNPSHLEGLEPTRTIIREARPIDLPAMYLIVAKRHAIEGWDSVLDTFGVPSIFMELPPGTSQEMADYYTALVRRIVGDGRGTIPSGAKFQTVETRQNTTTPFAERAKWCNEGIITLATGGLLTVSTEAGSGTLAGNAHADSLARLCALSARSISSCINRQWARRVLEVQYPGQPILARFELAPAQEEDTTATVQQLATLASAGWRPSDEVVSEMLGYEVRSTAKTLTTESTTDLAPITNSRREADAAAGIFPGEFEEEDAGENAPGVLEDIERMLARALKPEAIAAQAEALARGMEGALAHSVGFQGMTDGQEQAATQSPDQRQNTLRVENSCNQYAHEPGCPDADRPIASEDGTAAMTHTAYEHRPQEDEAPDGGWEDDEQEDPYAENPGWDEPEEDELVANSCNQHAHEPGCTGANLKKHKGMRRSRGNPAGKPTRSSSPEPKPRKGHATQKSIADGFDAALMGETTEVGQHRQYRLMMEPGSPGDGPPNWLHGEGALHVHAKHPDVTGEMIADIILQSRKREAQDARTHTRVAFRTEKGLVVFRPTGKKNIYTLVTAFIKKQ